MFVASRSEPRASPTTQRILRRSTGRPVQAEAARLLCGCTEWSEGNRKGLGNENHILGTWRIRLAARHSRVRGWPTDRLASASGSVKTAAGRRAGISSASTALAAASLPAACRPPKTRSKPAPTAEAQPPPAAFRSSAAGWFPSCGFDRRCSAGGFDSLFKAFRVDRALTAAPDSGLSGGRDCRLPCLAFRAAAECHCLERRCATGSAGFRPGAAGTMSLSARRPIFPSD